MSENPVTDSKGVEIHTGDKVKIISGAFVGQTGQVKRININRSIKVILDNDKVLPRLSPKLTEVIPSTPFEDYLNKYK